MAPSPFSDYKERHEYIAVIELPQSNTDVIGDGAFVVDVDITTVPEGGVQFLTSEPTLENNTESMNWTETEAFCVAKGGHLASGCPHDWQNPQSFILQGVALVS